MAKTPSGFVPLKTLKHGPPDAKAALAEIRRIYFATSKRTIDNDLAHAIDLLKSLPDEDEREKAAVYMEGAPLLWYRRAYHGISRRRPRGPDVL